MLLPPAPVVALDGKLCQTVLVEPTLVTFATFLVTKRASTSFAKLVLTVMVEEVPLPAADTAVPSTVSEPPATVAGGATPRRISIAI
jgi:hypothetical protein